MTPSSGSAKVKYYANATVSIYAHNFSLLCDPWLVDGAYDGSWYHFPPLQTRPEDLHDYTHIYISHIHPDHFDAQTLKRLPKKAPVVICDFGHPWLKSALEKLGFPVIEVKPGDCFEIAPGTRVWMYDSFTNNPLNPDTETPNVIDSAIVVESDEWAILNANDNMPDEKACSELRQRFGRVDLALLPYCGGGEYPSGFRNLTFEQKLAGAERVTQAYLNRFDDNLRILEPKLVLPFAGGYIIGGRMVEKNRCLGIPPVERAVERASKLGYQAVLPREGDVVDVVHRTMEHTLPAYEGVTQEQYEQHIRRIPYWFDQAFAIGSEQRIDLFPLMRAARQRLWEYQGRFDWHEPCRVMIKTEDSDENCFLFNYADPEILKVSPQATPDKPYVIIYVTYGKLLGLLTRHINWNSAGIGCHIEFYRDPEYYQPEVFALLPYLQI